MASPRGQQSLPLRFAPAAAMAVARARMFHCAALGCDLLPEACAARQQQSDRVRWPSCITERCAQGREVLRALGLLTYARCPCCGGSGRVLADRVGP